MVNAVVGYCCSFENIPRNDEFAMPTHLNVGVHIPVNDNRPAIRRRDACPNIPFDDDECRPPEFERFGHRSQSSYVMEPCAFHIAGVEKTRG